MRMKGGEVVGREGVRKRVGEKGEVWASRMVAGRWQLVVRRWRVCGGGEGRGGFF